MKIKSYLLVPAIALFTLLSSCDVVNKTLSLANCKYELGNVNNPSLGGVTLANVTNPNEISALNMLKLTAAIAQGSLPLSATVNVKASNPGVTAASIEKLEWAVDLENKQVLQGIVNQRVTVPANGGSTLIPFNLQLDVLKLAKSDSRNDILNLAMNLLNMGESSSKLSVRVKPTILVGNQPISSGFITLSKAVSSK